MIGNISQTKARLADICSLAWQTGLLRGFSGNASARISASQIVITISGVAKGRLGESDFVVVNPEGVILSGKGKPSLELGLHLAIYKTVSNCNAILHTHPIWLQAAAMLLARKERSERLLKLNIAESDYWSERMAIVPELAPGSHALAMAALKALATAWPDHEEPLLPCALWLTGHGLCALGESPGAALGISEQLERLGQLQWAVLDRS